MQVAMETNSLIRGTLIRIYKASDCVVTLESSLLR